MDDMTEEQWARLFIALGQVPVVDAAMNLDTREVRILCELAIKGANWEQSGILHMGNGDRSDALDLAFRLGIDPATAEPPDAVAVDEPTSAAQGEAVDLDAFVAQLCSEGA